MIGNYLFSEVKSTVLWIKIGFFLILGGQNLVTAKQKFIGYYNSDQELRF